jgi:hypothetical protein
MVNAVGEIFSAVHGRRFVSVKSRLWLVGGVVAVIVLSLGSGVASAGGAHTSSKTLTVYSVGAYEQFLNHEDDRARGEGDNPFGRFTDATAVAQPSAAGPFPGDQAIFQLTVFKDPSLKTKIGTAEFNCLYNFNKNGYCDVLFQLRAGTLSGSGAFNFNATKFTLAITGGTGTFDGARGVVSEAPAQNHAQRLAFVFS